ncbi:diguanylate cyclase (GGDEF)-like protein [Inhella inkyongensis]|uniref:diguanylate cyclase n=1 Tax=Inhella inkyongensis TaxID=392593 RepID=A0A840S129_9BURK|nr:ligand-binding sensor domain-containing diguanylate cyclase [Inhella inkyongensis]MBB5203108.1 diguanylate cyclase (GGDEF)-like protein [Inhella inkyongensis]
MRALLVLLLALVCSGAQAERPALAEPRFELVSDGGVITDGVVSALAVDAKGFLWIGTAVGLVRFDGYEFLPLALPGAQSPATGTTFVRSLLAARDGRLWIGTDSDGLVVHDPATAQWQFFRPDRGFVRGTVRALAEDRQGRIWAATVGGGLQMIEPANGRITRWGVEQGLPDDRVQSLWVDRQGTVWAGTWSGLARLRPGQPRFEMAPPPIAFAGRLVSALYQDSNARLWVGTQGGDLVRVDAQLQGLQVLDSAGSGAGSINVLVDVAGDETWVGRANGVEIRRRSDGSLLRLLRQSVSRPWGLAGSDVRAMAVDGSGVLWVGSYGGGLQRHTEEGSAVWVRRPEAREDSVLGVIDARSLVVTPAGEVWVGTNDRGLAVLDLNLQLRAEIRPAAQGYRGGRVGGLALDGAGRIWAGSDEGVALFEASSRRWLRQYSLGRGRVRILLASRDGAVLAGTQDGLYRWQPGQAEFERLGLPGNQPLKGDVNALAQGADGAVWVGGELGLYRLEPGAQSLLSIESSAGEGLLDQTVLGLLVDERQQLWVDTSAGLHRMLAWQGGQARFEALSPRIGQAGKSFGANLEQDAAGRIWTHRGAYDPQSQQFEGLSSADGVDIGTGWFRSHARLPDGRLLFGGSRGLLVVDPARFKPWRYEPAIEASELRIDGVSVPLSRLQPALQLGPEERSFTLEYTAMDFSMPVRNRYRHRLEGHQSEWIEGDANERSVSYGGLAPGRYTLRVQGSNRNGVWSRKELAVAIEVSPQWWQTWWARGLTLVGLLGLIGFAVQIRTRLLRLRQAALEQRVLERTEALASATAALEEKSRALEDSALTDPLTGLRNRRFVIERLDDDLRLVQRQLEEAQRRGLAPPVDTDLCLFMIDIDHFKQVNDQHGHAAGDAVLVQMRERLQRVFRESDYLVRWGGEEFLVVARGSNRAGAAELAERVRRHVAEQPFDLGQGRTLGRTCSIGFACFPLQQSQPRATGWAIVLDLADAALYRAKRSGRNRWVGVLQAHGLDEAGLRASLDALANADAAAPAGLELISS